jgi:two-component system nitrogen regulation sensor histidine kinase NtrY
VTGTANLTQANAAAEPDSRPERRRGWMRRLGYLAAILSLLSVSATFFILLGLTSIEPTGQVVAWALVANGVFLLALLVAVAWEIRRLFRARRRGEAGARLHVRIVALFAVVAVIPAVLVAVVANITFAQGADHWFSSRTQQMVEASRNVAEQYIDAQLSSLGEVTRALKGDIEDAQPLFLGADWENFQRALDPLPTLYNVKGVVLIDDAGEAVAAAPPGDQIDLPAPPPSLIARAVANAPDAFVTSPTPVTRADGVLTAFAAGMVMLDNYGGLLLYVVAEFQPQAVAYMQAAAENTAAYQELLDIRSGMQLVFGLIYFGVALMVLAAAIWMGLAVANRLVSPIGRLITAADNVAKGDLSVEVPVRHSDGDLATLGESFNEMTHQLAGQRAELLSASEQNDSRRRFIEAVLSGVTAGVIGVDGEERVTVFNRSALNLIDRGGPAMLGAQIRGLVPELGPVLEDAARDRRREHRDQITLLRAGKSRTINVRVTTERSSAEGTGYVITLDDITDLLAAQRTSVWADVARRIAHEIKNPLTPIQLSAERLRRKFGARIEEDRDVFDQCTDTIIRQVADIGRMVDEFSAFARMPKPSLEVVDIREGLRDAVFLMQVGHPDVDVTVDIPDEPMTGRFDVRLLSQMITNLIKNGVEAIEALDPPAERGHVEVCGSTTEGAVIVEVIDDGIGLPRENRQMLLEPYMTTREKGTGLGLAIVRKIVEDHSGTVELLDAPDVAKGGHGAMVRLCFPRLPAAGNSNDREAEHSARDSRNIGKLAPVAE